MFVSYQDAADRFRRNITLIHPAAEFFAGKTRIHQIVAAGTVQHKSISAGTAAQGSYSDCPIYRSANQDVKPFFEKKFANIILAIYILNRNKSSL